MNLEKEVDKYLRNQAKLDEQSKKLIDYFNKTYSKKEVACIVEFLIENSAGTYDEQIQEFKVHYESTIRGVFSVKDIKTFNTLFKVYKNQMKEPKSLKGDRNLQTQNGIAEEENE